MGVYGLTSHIANNSSLYFNDYKLHDCLIIIDGNAVASFIFKTTADVNNFFGGDYDKYCHSVRNFISLLLKCNVYPIIVFDGGYESRKLRTVLHRIKDNIITCGQQQNKSESNSFPLMLRDVFKMVLLEFKVTLIQSHLEADNEIIILAKVLKCPIISLDSDFYLSNIDYIPLTKINFRFNSLKTNSDEIQKYYIPCEKFDREKFFEEIGGLKDRSLLPLLSCALGNDYFSPSTFKQNLNIENSMKFGERLKKVCKWLNTVNSAKAAINELTKKKQGREELNKKIIFLLEEFNRSNSVLLLHIPAKYVRSMSEVKLCAVHNLSSLFPEWLEKKFVTGQISPMLMNIYYLQKIFILSQYEFYQWKPSHEIIIPILQIIITIVFRDQSVKTVSVKCHARYKGSVMGVTSISPLSNSSLPNLSFIPNLSIEERRNIIIKELKVPSALELYNFPEELWLYVISIWYWNKNCNQPRVNLIHIRILILCFIYLSLIDEKIGFTRNENELNELCIKKSIEKESNCSEKRTLKCNNIHEILEFVSTQDCYCVAKNMIHRHSVDKNSPFSDGKGREKISKSIHAFAQLQHCMQSIIFFNAVLNFPFTQFKPHFLFSGSFANNLYEELKGQNILDSYIINRLLLNAESLVIVYQKFLICLESIFSSDTHDTKKQTDNKKRRKKKNKKIMNNTNNISNVHNLTNKFNILLLSEQ